jgi:hypothetical protein
VAHESREVDRFTFVVGFAPPGMSVGINFGWVSVQVVGLRHAGLVARDAHKLEAFRSSASTPWTGVQLVRVTAAFSRLLKIDGITERKVEFGDQAIEVTIRPRRRRLVCPLYAYSCRSRMTLGQRPRPGVRWIWASTG